MKNVGTIQLFESKNNAVEFCVTDLQYPACTLKISIGEDAYTGQLSDGKGAIEIGAVPTGLDYVIFYLEKDGVTFAYGYAELIQVEGSGTTPGACATPCDASVTEAKLDPDLKADIAAKLSAVNHDGTLTGDGSSESPLGVADAVMESLGNKLSAVAHDDTLTGDGTAGSPLSVVGGDTEETDPVAMAALALHEANHNNPHQVTAEQIGALTAESDTLALGAIAAHAGDTNNPHQVTKAKIGLENVDNTSDMNKPVSTAVAAAIAAVNGATPHSCIIRMTEAQLALSTAPVIGQVLWCSNTSGVSLIWAASQPGISDCLVGVVTKVPSGEDTAYEVTVINIGANGFVSCIADALIVGTPVVGGVVSYDDSDADGVFRLVHGAIASLPFGLYAYLIGQVGGYSYLSTSGYSGT